MEDWLLIQQFQEGNRIAFDVLVDRYKHRLYSFAFKLIRDHHEAEDISQETFIRAYHGLNQFRGEGNFLSWLFSIAVNYYRSLKRKRRLKLEANVKLEKIAKMDEENVDIFTEEAKLLAKSAIDRLPQKQKLVLILRTYEELSYQEIAQVIGISKESVKANLSYARQALRNELQEVLT